ncbi:hypothetical protein EDE12_1011143 [Methylosinus sp. sav-2]|jgi:hypothetical protein|nr:hypothetical protein EDE12_1011143 [Methylosinus sp. sav-2]
MQTSSAGVVKALMGIGGVLAFFLIVMHQLSQLFR